ncbi:hypothetical protein AGR8A_pTi20003 [Agrobacterium fabrum str. J-07]|nr:hypothetical protein AGR8A_pTi20003 [Agrobacterium fabrum str. J-07]
MVDEIDSAMAERAMEVGNAAGGGWAGLVAEGVAYIEMALQPDVQRIVLLDEPSVLGDPSQWPSQGRCLQATISTCRIWRMTDTSRQSISRPWHACSTALLHRGHLGGGKCGSTHHASKGYRGIRMPCFWLPDRQVDSVSG